MPARDAAFPIARVPLHCSKPCSHTGFGIRKHYKFITRTQLSLLCASWSTMAVDRDFNLIEEGFSESSLGSLASTSEGGKKKDRFVTEDERQIEYRIKLNMAIERTFTSWITTGMQIGAIGTLVLLALDPKRSTAWGIITLAFAWIVGFAIALYGLIGYYGRRRALESNTLSTDPAVWCPFAPALLMISLVAVVIPSLVYVGLAQVSSTTLSSNLV